MVVGVVSVLAVVVALVALDVGPAPESSPAYAQAVRNATIVIQQGGARKG